MTGVNATVELTLVSPVYLAGRDDPAWVTPLSTGPAAGATVTIH